MAQARANDEAEKCRKLASLGIKTLLGRVERNCRNKLFSMAFAWLQESKVSLDIMYAECETKGTASSNYIEDSRNSFLFPKELFVVVFIVKLKNEEN